MNSASAEYYMRKTLSLAAQALEQGEFPIAAVVVLDEQVIARATTAEHRQGRFLVHAELLALDQADKQGLAFEQRRRATLFTNLEPCLMCLGAAMSFFLGDLVYGLESPADGAVNLVQDWAREAQDMPGYQLPRLDGGLLRDESITLFARYVAQCPPGPRRDWAETLTRL
jgi:tRNA(adenine34) deaminase